jgi:phenylalanyl-tRNA synthetase alpha chain
LFDDFKLVEPALRKELGKHLNELKQAAEQKWKEAQENVANQPKEKTAKQFDASAPAWNFPVGSRHPLSIIANEIQEIFSKIGFTVAEGPEIEDDWHNFSALNFPKEHPARDMQDTFFISAEPEIAPITTPPA